MDPFYKLVAKILGLFVATVFFCRFTWGYGLVVIPVAVLYFALTAKTGALIMTSMFLPLLVVINPILMPRTAVFAQIARLSAIFVQLILIFSGAARGGGNRQLPLGGLLPYLIVAFISSTIGYFPLISYLKIINFLIFLLSIYIGTRNMDYDPSDMRIVRAGLLAFSILMIHGSLLTLPFPSIAYYTSLKKAVGEYGSAYVDYMYSGSEEGKMLFSGISLHSQFLGPALAVLGAWVLLDLFFIERGMSKLHVALLAPLPVMLYMTRSRIGLFTMVVAFSTMLFYCFPRMRIAPRLKTMAISLLTIIIVVILAVGVIAEVNGGYVSKWVRKTDDVKQDDRAMTAAITDSRQGAINLCMRDFQRNRFLGMGFQVVEGQRQLYDEGKINLFSAPIEKGVLPIMILGETGILGEFFFAIFLLLFFSGCAMRGYFASSTMFAVFLATNMAEATFFSPSGGGGFEWMVCVIGGFVIDLSITHLNGKLGVCHV